ncbi:hypothetical protein J6590_099380, partial [Homalodisca vitripennis]
MFTHGYVQYSTLSVQPRPHHRASTVRASNEPARCLHTVMYNTRHCQCNRVLTTGQVQSTPVTSQLDVHTRICTCTTLADIVSATTSSPQGVGSPSFLPE